MTLRLDAMTSGGEALGRHEGKAIFVRGGLPGELVRIVVEDDRARFARARVVEVREQLQRLGRVPDPPVRDIIASPAIWQYRNHAQFHFTADGQPGFQCARSHRVAAIEECHVVEPPLAEWLTSNHIETVALLRRANRAIL